jgi:hypothetical protein
MEAITATVKAPAEKQRSRLSTNAFSSLLSSAPSSAHSRKWARNQPDEERKSIQKTSFKEYHS